MATDIDEPTYEATDTVSAGTAERPQPEQTESEKALVKRIQKAVKADKDFHGPAFKRMREDMFMARTGRTAEYSEGNYTVNLAGRHVKQKTAALYAKNPKAVARRRETLDFQVWDESPQSLKMAMQFIQTAQQMMAAAANPVDPASGAPVVDVATGAPPVPAEPPPELQLALQKAMSIVQDFQAGMQKRDLLDKVGKTLEVLFHQSMREQQPLNFKKAMKRAVRRACTTGVCYVELGFQREMGPRPAMLEKLADLRARLDHLRRLTEDVTSEEGVSPDDPEIAELELSVASLQQEPEVIIREGLIYDFPQSTKVIPDKLTKSLVGFEGARHITLEYMYTCDEVREVFGVDLGKSYRGYKASGETDKTETAEKNEEGVFTISGKGSGLVCVWKHYDKAAGLVYYVADGYDKFLRPPAAPDVFVNSFWPVYACTFNDVEDENSLFPPSDVRLMRSQQEAYNRARQGMNDHRWAARPRWVTGRGTFEAEDKKDLGSLLPFELAELNLGAQTDIKNVLQALPIPGVDPNLYETAPLFTDIQLTVGSSESQFGLTGKATATGETIAAGATKSADDSSIDDLDSFLTDIANAAGQILLKEMSEEQVKVIAGAGAVWPHMTLAEIASELYLEIEAGSSGKPNQAVEIQNWKEMLPFLIQMPDISPTWLARESVRRLDDKADLTEAISEGTMSILAQNGLAQVSTGNPATDPNAQGGEGASNAPKEESRTAGSGPAFGDNKV
jgi:hypothetical protein